MQTQQAHERPDPVPHRFLPQGMGKIVCGVCRQDADHEWHRVGLANEIGADASQCPGCEQIWPIDMTVRMMRFVRPDGQVLTGRHLRVCFECAGHPVDHWAMLALRRERGWITEDDYVELVAKLAHETADRATEARDTLGRPMPCAEMTRYGVCTQMAGHPGSHTYQAIKAQKR